MITEVDHYIENAEYWKEEMQLCRSLLIDCGLVEEWKWKQPCYTYKGTNVAIIGEFKSFCTISFFKGALLKDPEGILQKPGENSQSARIFKFTDKEEILSREELIRSYIFEAIEVEKQGLKVEFKEKKQLVFPDELHTIFEKDSAFKAAFEALTPGKQRGYNLFWTGAKQSATRTSQIQKYRERILDGKGIHDCVCGLSKRYPRCDGSHKQLEE
jgi:uncharacterized protein YdeI (YjbR/CyaY-like superfamily)